MQTPICRLVFVLLFAGGTFGPILAEDAHALRPFRAATDAAVVDPGVVELELGFDVTRNTLGDADETSFAVPSAVFNIGIADRFEIDIATGFDLVVDDEADRTLGSFRDTGLTLKTLWWKSETPAPSVATELTLNFPTARTEFQPDEHHRVGVTGLVALTGDVPPLRYILDLGGGVRPSPRDADHVGVFLWAVAAEITVTARVAVVAELQGAVMADANPETTGLLGFTHTSAGGVKFDLAGFAGLTDNSPNWGLTFGITYAFQILHPRH